MSDPAQTTSQIQHELLAEVQAELHRRTTSMVTRKVPPTPPPAAGDDRDFVTPLILAGLLSCLALLAGTGIGISLGYAPSMDDASASLDWMQRAGLAGTLVRGLHWHAANLLVALCGAYLFWLLWRGLYRRPMQWRWWRACLLLGLVVAFSLTGQFLPYDQNALHGTAIRMGYVAEAPLVGGLLRDMATGGALGTAALARFFSIHTLILPVLALMLLRWMWADAKPQGALWPVLAVALSVVAVCMVASLVVAAPLGLQGDVGESYPQARPEWFALPLYTLMKLLPPGLLHLLALFAPPLLGGLALAGLPYADRQSDQPTRLLRPLRIAALVGVISFAGLCIVTVMQDYQAQAGWFAQDDLEDLMGQMGRRNAALGHSTQPLPASAHLPARDTRELARRLAGLYVKDIAESDKPQWDQWAQELADKADALLTTTAETERRKLRTEMRKICADCHKLHADDEISLEPKLPQAQTKADPPKLPDPPKLLPLLDAAKLAGLMPTKLEDRDLKSTRRLMSRAKSNLRDLLRSAGQATGDATGKPEQSWLDLTEDARLFGAMQEQNKGTHPDTAKWQAAMKDLNAALQAVKDAKQGTEAGEKLDAVGKTCDACHKQGDWGEPFDWLYADLKVR
ncbi:MAG: cytochrome b N-terminal domain-containing protein [Planctomycetes bacterium]|nr:cytochrome b N-terminal domain-containing protein [Planctomycetota bacterium]